MKTKLMRFECVLILLTICFGALNAHAQSPQEEPAEVENAQQLTKTTRVRITAFRPASDPTTVLRSARSIFVRSNSLLVKGAVVEDKLQKRKEFTLLNLVITRDLSSADLILELRHDLFTMYVYSVVDRRSGVVLATGKLSSLGGTVAGKVAERFMKQLVKARA